MSAAGEELRFGKRTGRRCRCVCHRRPGVVHVAACCIPARSGGTGLGDTPGAPADTGRILKIAGGIALVIWALSGVFYTPKRST